MQMPGLAPMQVPVVQVRPAQQAWPVSPQAWQLRVVVPVPPPAPPAPPAPAVVVAQRKPVSQVAAVPVPQQA